MSSLKEVRIKNFRSFGAEQHLPISPQVTILLAPNGTGKTSFFQAVELGLTGAILALANDGLKPAVRDHEQAATVDLTFDDAERRVELPVTGIASLSGSLEPIFGNLDTADLSFLLRLTHLLDQHSDRWLVSRSTKDAGGALSALPIGRDASLAQATLRKLNPAVTRQVTAAAEQLDEAKAARESWQAALAERDAAAGDLDRPLLSLVDMAEQLSALFSVERAPVDPRREAIGEALARASAVQDATRRTLERTLASLRAWQSQIAMHDEAQASLAQAEVAHQEAVQRVAATQLAVKEAEGALKQAGALRGQRNAARDALLAQSEIIRRYNEAKARQQAAGLAVEAAETTLKDARANAEILVSRLKEWLTLEANHAAAEARVATAKRTLEGIEERRKAVADLRAHREVVAELRTKVANANAAHAAAVTGLERLAGERDRLVVLRDAAGTAMDALQEAGGAVHAALSQIWHNLPKSQGDCPVCLEPHGAAKLQERMTKARARTDPALASAAEELKRISDFTAKAQADASRQSVVVEGLNAQRATLRSELEFAEQQERDLIAVADPAGLGLTNVDRRLDGGMKEALAEADEGARALGGLDQRPGSDELAKLRVQVEQARADEAGRQRVLAAAVEALGSETLAVEALRMEAAPIEDPAGLAGRLSASEALVMDAARVESELQQRSKTARQELNLAEGARSTAESMLGDARRLLDGFLARWRNLGLEGSPNAETLEAALSDAAVRLAKFRADEEAVAHVNEELGRWDFAVAKRRKEAAVQQLRGGDSEEQHTARLDAIVKVKEREQAEWHRNSEALVDLNGQLKSELDQVRELVQAMVPDWQALLRQVVRDTRFAETRLRYFAAHRVDHAETSVPLHGEYVEARLVASEAQLTELQLTFLLAMARRHAWSPWRGLLLDDPTQHHDLVHAAAVFDVLRDYVVEDGFQLVMATHDALQARYFMRKLRNDCVQTTFIQLYPSSGGVVARAD